MNYKFDWRAHVVSAAELQAREFPPVRYVVDGLIPEGLTLLAGPPKIGKSWLILDIALAVASRKKCLDGRKVVHGDVLYCALEDNDRRLQRRIEALLGTNAKSPEELKLSTVWARANQGGIRAFEEWSDSVNNPALIAVDTLEKVRPPRTNKNSYADDYGAVEELHQLANERGIPVMVSHHTRKMPSEHPLDLISGTLGLTAGVDTPMVLYHGAQGKNLYISGRDIEEVEYAVKFDRAKCRWTILGDAEEVRRSDIRNAILDILRDAEEPMGPTAPAQLLRLDANTVRQRLFQMYQAGEVEKVGTGKYVHPDNDVAKSAGGP